MLEKTTVRIITEIMGGIMPTWMDAKTNKQRPATKSAAEVMRENIGPVFIHAVTHSCRCESGACLGRF